MPARSKAQFGKMGVLYRQGKISRKTLREYNKGVSGRRYKRLPEHANRKAQAARRAAAARKVAERLRRKRKRTKK